MKQLSEQVHVDKTAMRFYAACSDCGKRVWAGKLPLLCRRKVRLSNGMAPGGGLWQQCYLRSRASAVKRLARYFNCCPHCGRWVCDECFDLADGYGACRHCAEPTELPTM